MALSVANANWANLIDSDRGVLDRLSERKKHQG